MISVKTKIAGIDVATFAEGQELNVKANFGSTNTPDLLLENVTFKNNERTSNSTILRNYHASNPLEGVDVNLEISNSTESYNFEFYTDWSELRINSDVSTSVKLRKKDSVSSVEDSLAGITMELLRQEGFFGPANYANFPYVVENRKTLLEKIQILFQGYTILKALYDELFKIINIASDITTLGAIPAAVNLALVATNIVLLVNQISALVQEIYEAFFPLIRYHKAITWKQGLDAFFGYLGYDVEYGDYLDFENVLSGTIICPSKDDEVGATAEIITGVSGILKSRDFGYNGKDFLEATRKIFYTRVEIIEGVVHVRPEIDPFWLRFNSLQVNVKIEDVFAQNGSYRYNYDEFFNNRIIRYSQDDSDLHTLSNINDQISVVTVEPDSVTDQRRVIRSKGYVSEIPYALAVRKDDVDDLLDLLIGANDELEELKELVIARFEEYVDLLSESSPLFGAALSLVGGFLRSGACKIENNFFSIPKIGYFVKTQNGTRLPVNYTDFIGAGALENKYHKYLSFAEGVRDADNPNDTNAKLIYEGVRIRFSLSKFSQLLDKPYFTFNGKIAKFTEVDWNIQKDVATVNFWVQENWMTNISETTS